MRVASDFSSRLCKAMGEKGIRQNELARMTGIRDSVISAYCTGRKTPRTERMCRIAQTLGITEEYFTAEFESNTFDPDDAYFMVMELVKDNIESWTDKQRINLIKLFADDLTVYAVTGRGE